MAYKDFVVKPKAVSTAEISEMLGVSVRRIQQLAKEDALVKLGHGKFDLIKSIKRYIDYQVDQRSPMVEDEEELNPQVERALWTREKRKKTELEVKIIKGELHRSKDVERITGDMLASFRARLLNLPDKVAPLLIAKTDLQDINDTVRLAVYEALNELSEYDPEVYYDYSTDKLFLEKDEDEEDEEDMDDEVVQKVGKSRK